MSIAFKILPVVAIFATTPALAASFTVTSDTPVNGRLPQAQFANINGCGGGNQSPHLSWFHAPAGTKSFAVTMFDPDANDGKGFWHWLAADIPAAVHDLPAGAALPAGSLTFTNSFGKSSYNGPCPPAGQDHHYVLTVYALKVAHLGAIGSPEPQTLSARLKGDALASASLTARAAR